MAPITSAITEDSINESITQNSFITKANNTGSNNKNPITIVRVPSIFRIVLKLSFFRIELLLYSSNITNIKLSLLMIILYNNFNSMINNVYFRYKKNSIPVTISKSARKSLSISIKTVNEILVKSPIFLQKKQILKFIEKNTSWIYKKILFLEEISSKFSFTIGSKVPFFGNNIYICSGERTFFKNDIFINSKKLDIKKELLSLYKKTAREYITDRVNLYCNILNIKYNKIFIKSQKTRWGSCSAKNNLNFNWKVILTPKEYIDYLIIHEVCHLIELNHSKKFWILVKQLDPNYKENRKGLMNYGYYLHNFLD